ncbi:NADH dehydrogenase [Devosia crocina]|uniref:NADH dehydrogenase n=1 Tax=Devosia crocina TaxID=429728 RepID=A0A1I7NAW5_9HYPH|nr:FAD-dependent oxidoreductase [Devosia crocina]SFV31686.1 NADH dehydrogenase [Devosia crocina]
MRSIVVLGGGYAGLHAFSNLRARLGAQIKRGEIGLTLISRDGHHTYHGWTGEVLAGDLPVRSTLTELQPLLGNAFIKGNVLSADLEGRTLTVDTENGDQVIAYDHLVMAAGSTDPFDRIPGLAQNGWCVKNTRDMQKLVTWLEDLDASNLRPRNVVVIGGGLAGVETVSALAARYARLGGRKVNVRLVSSSKELLPALRPAFGHIADRAVQTLEGQGVSIKSGNRVAMIEADHIVLDDGQVIGSDLSIVAAGVSFQTLQGTEALPRNAAGQIVADRNLRVRGFDNIWVAGDIAAAAHPGTGEPCPTNALWAMKQGDCVGRNIARQLRGQSLKAFNFRGLGQAAGLAGQSGITELWGLQFTGRLAWVIRVLFFAWFMPSHRGALSVLAQFGANLGSAALEAAFGRRDAAGSVSDSQAAVANMPGRLR